MKTLTTRVSRRMRWERTLWRLNRPYRHFADPRGSRIGYLGWALRGNVGDDACLLAHQRTLPLSVDVLPYGDEYTLRMLRIGAALSRRGSVAGILVGGGTIIGRAVWRERLAAIREVVGDVPVAFVGLGVEDPEFAGYERHVSGDELRSWCELLSGAAVASVRGPRSQELLASAGCDVRVAGDSALLLADAEPASDVREKTLGISVADPEDRWAGGDGREELVAALRGLVADGWRLRFLALEQDDLQACGDVARRLGIERDIAPVSVVGVLDAVRSCHAVVAERLHAVVLASATYTPVLALGYRPKLTDFQRSLGRERFVLRSDRLRATDVRERLADLAERRDAHRDALFEQVAERRRLLLAERDAVARAFSVDGRQVG